MKGHYSYWAKIEDIRTIKWKRVAAGESGGYKREEGCHKKSRAVGRPERKNPSARSSRPCRGNG